MSLRTHMRDRGPLLLAAWLDADREVPLPSGVHKETLERWVETYTRHPDRALGYPPLFDLFDGWLGGACPWWLRRGASHGLPPAAAWIDLRRGFAYVDVADAPKPPPGQRTLHGLYRRHGYPTALHTLDRLAHAHGHPSWATAVLAPLPPLAIPSGAWRAWVPRTAPVPRSAEGPK